MFSFTRTKTSGQRNESEHQLIGPPCDDKLEAVGTPLATTEEAAGNLRALGLPPTASWEQATEAYRRLVSDLTPGPDASHRNVALAEDYLHEVNQAYASLRTLAVA